MNIIQRLLARFKPKPKFQPITCKVVDGKLILDIPIPPGAPKDQVVAHIKEILLATSALHIAHGGSGLKIDNVFVTQHKPDSDAGGEQTVRTP
jgi:hypothetical protein